MEVLDELEDVAIYPTADGKCQIADFGDRAFVRRVKSGKVDEFDLSVDGEAFLFDVILRFS